MGMNTYIKGFREETEDYKAKATAWYACIAASIEPPEELYAYFNDEPPKYGNAIEVDISNAVIEAIDGMRMFWDVDLTKLPKDVVRLRFVNSY